MGTKIRSSSQLLVDDNLDLNSKKQVNVLAGTASTDGVNKGQVETLISNAITAGSPALHIPVQNLAAAKAVGAAERVDKMLMNIEDLGLYRFDSQSTVTSNDAQIIRPTDIASDAVAGRWIQMSGPLSDHSQLSNVLGNGQYHLSLAERDKLLGIEAGADVTDTANVGAAISAVGNKNYLNDNDTVPLSDSAAGYVMKKISWIYIKESIVTYLGNIYQPLSAKDATGGYVGMTLFKINFKNTLNTFTSFFTNANTAARTYTFPDKDGTVAMTSDITSSAETTATIGALINGANAAVPNDTDLVATADASILKKITWTNVKAFFKTYFDTLYEKVANKDASNGYAGLTLLKINFKNTLNTFTSFFVNANTAARTYTFPDRDGTIADNTDITAAKARANHTGTQLAATISDFAAAALAAAPAETVSTIGTLIGTTAAAKATPVDADEIGISDSAAAGILKSMSFTNLKAFLKTYFDTVYNNYVHPNHTGDVTSVGGGATTITANAVTNAKAAQMPANTIKINNTGVAANAIDGSIAQVKTMLGLNTNNQSTRVFRAALVQVTSTSHTINVTGFISDSEEVTRNGVVLDNLGNDYSLNYVDNVIEIILTTGLAAGEKLKINYNYSA
jgi:hypothetical protein